MAIRILLVLSVLSTVSGCKRTYSDKQEDLDKSCTFHKVKDICVLFCEAGESNSKRMGLTEVDCEKVPVE